MDRGGARDGGEAQVCTAMERNDSGSDERDGVAVMKRSWQALRERERELFTVLKGEGNI